MSRKVTRIANLAEYNNSRTIMVQVGELEHKPLFGLARKKLMKI